MVYNYPYHRDYYNNNFYHNIQNTNEDNFKNNYEDFSKKDNNNLANTCKAVYEKMFGEDMEQIISQGVVEGGFFVSKKQDCEYICIGPNLYDAHSPSERLSIKSTLKVWKYLKKLIRKI